MTGRHRAPEGPTERARMAADVRAYLNAGWWAPDAVRLAALPAQERLLDELVDGAADALLGRDP